MSLDMAVLGGFNPRPVIAHGAMQYLDADLAQVGVSIRAP